MRVALRRFCFGFLVTSFAVGGVSVVAQDWQDATAEPVRLAPSPAEFSEALVQVYGARAKGAKGLFGVHTWVAVKPSNAPSYTVYEVIGWRLRWADSVVVKRSRQPDGDWFGAKAELYAEKRGPGVDELIKRVEKAVTEYPYAKEYTVWPGPNSNTFTAWISRSVPELEIDLPATAIGKDYLGGALFGAAPSGSGFQVSLGGLLGVAASAVDGVELNLLGLNFGVSPNGLKLPMVGWVGGFKPALAAPEARPAEAPRPAETARID